MFQQTLRFGAGLSFVIGALLPSAVLAQSPSDAYRGAADAYRQAAAKSPARSACYLQWASYYDALAAMQNVAAPALDPGCSGGAGDVGGSIGTITAPSSSSLGGGFNARPQSGWAAGLQAGSQIAQNLLGQFARRQAAERQVDRSDSVSDDPRVYDRRDKRLPPEQIGADLNPGAYDYPVTWDPAEATYGPSQGGGFDLWTAEEPVIDGSNIPPVIDFLDPMQSIPHVPQIGLDGKEIPDTIEFPVQSCPEADSNFDLFTQVSKCVRAVGKRQGLGR
jgi:hypothetical protein